MTFGTSAWEAVRMGMLSCGLLSCFRIWRPGTSKIAAITTISVGPLCVGLGEKGLSTPSCWTTFGTS